METYKSLGQKLKNLAADEETLKKLEETEQPEQKLETNKSIRDEPLNTISEEEETKLQKKAKPQ